MRKKEFVKFVEAEINANDDYGGILGASCNENHAFNTMLE